MRLHTAYMEQINVAKVNFTASRIEAHKCAEGKDQSILWDSAAPGLGLRATAKGAKAYIFQAKINGKEPRITIGNPATWRLPQAREEARRLKVIIDNGKDPREVKAAELAANQATRDEQQRATTRNAVTLAEVWAIYLEARKPRWSKGHYQNHLNLAATGGEIKKRGRGTTTTGPLAPLMQLPLSSLTSDKIAEWLDRESVERPTNTAQSFRILRALIRWADDIPAYRGLIPPNTGSSRKVRDSVPKNETKEDDCLQREQLSLWFAAVKKIDNPVSSAYLQGLLLTGARRRELAQLRWEDVDFEWCKMSIGDKVEEKRTIPLTPYLSKLLIALPRCNDWVFSSPNAASGHIESPTKTHQKALAVARLPHISIHGLRRSFGTLAEWVDAPTGVVAQIMGHKPSAIAEKHYRRRSLDLLRMWHVKIENWILEQANGTNLP